MRVWKIFIDPHSLAELYTASSRLPHLCQTNARLLLLRASALDALCIVARYQSYRLHPIALRRESIAEIVVNGLNNSCNFLQRFGMDTGRPLALFPSRPGQDCSELWDCHACDKNSIPELFTILPIRRLDVALRR